MRTTTLACFILGLGFTLACGGLDLDEAAAGAASAASTDAAPAHGSVAFHTYEHGRHRLRFNTESTATFTWRNMSGPPVTATYTHDGDLITVNLNPEAENTGALMYRFRQLDDCSIARFHVTMKDGEVREDDSRVFQRTEPRCPRR